MSDPAGLICDLSHAPDSPEQRLSGYRELFSALVGRTWWGVGFRFRFDAERVDRRLLAELVAGEQACCPFLRSTVSSRGGEVWWDVVAETDAAGCFLDALRALPDALAEADANAGHADAVTAAGIRIRLHDEAVSSWES